MSAGVCTERLLYYCPSDVRRLAVELSGPEPDSGRLELFLLFLRERRARREQQPLPAPVKPIDIT